MNTRCLCPKISIQVYLGHKYVLYVSDSVEHPEALNF